MHYTCCCVIYFFCDNDNIFGYWDPNVRQRVRGSVCRTHVRCNTHCYCDTDGQYSLHLYRDIAESVAFRRDPEDSTKKSVRASDALTVSFGGGRGELYRRQATGWRRRWRLLQARGGSGLVATVSSLQQARRSAEYGIRRWAFVAAVSRT